MKFSGYAITLVAMAVAGCGEAPQQEREQSKAQEEDVNSPETIDAMVEVGAKKLITEKMKDPDSVKFSGVKVSRASGNPIACGRVNANNSFGGKTGAQRFISNGANLAFLEEEMEAGVMDQVWSQFCA